MYLAIKQNRLFALLLIFICLLYLVFELFFNQFLIFSVDEFWFAHNIYYYKDHLPYRDFFPYKTVLGYYILLPSMLSGLSGMKAMIFTKNIIAIINSFCWLIASFWLTKFFSRYAVFTSLAFILCTESVLSYSTNIRVDLLGYWFCLFSILALLDRRYFLSGLFLGFGFIATQKTLWYIFASNLALFLFYAYQFRFNLLQRKIIENIFFYNTAICMVVTVYLIFWSIFAGWTVVFNSVFYEASVIYKLSWYANMRWKTWPYLARYNPFIILFWPLTIISLMISFNGDKRYLERLFIIIYTFIIFFCLFGYKQIFLYYSQVTLPVLLVLYASFFNWFYGIFENNNRLKILANYLILWLFVSSYSLLLLLLIHFFHLPILYSLLIPATILLCLYCQQPKLQVPQYALMTLKFCMFIFIIVGIVVPINLMIPHFIHNKGDYQKANLAAANTLLQDSNNYVAGIELFYNKTQPVPGMRHLVGYAIDYLYHPTPELREPMLSSLYLDPNASIDSIISAIDKKQIKFYVNNYLMLYLPAKIQAFLDDRFEHFWGSIYLYAPRIPSGEQRFILNFNSRYCVESNVQVLINNAVYQPQSCHYFTKGIYTSSAKLRYRLKMMPEDKKLNLSNQFKHDNLFRMVIT